MARKDESGLVGLVLTLWRISLGLIIPIFLGALALTSVLHGLPETMAKFSNGIPMDIAIMQSYGDYVDDLTKMYQPGGKFKFKLIAPALIGGAVSAFLYLLFKGKFWKQKA